jgi:hypothetical protein
VTTDGRQAATHRLTLKGGPSPSDLKIELDGRALMGVTALKVEAAAEPRTLVKATLTFITQVDIDTDVVAALAAENIEAQMVAPDARKREATRDPTAGPGA